MRHHSLGHVTPHTPDKPATSIVTHTRAGTHAHTHTGFLPACKNLQSSSIPQWTSFILFQIHELSQLELHVASQSPWTGTAQATSTCLRVCILQFQSLWRLTQTLFCIPWGRQISSRYRHTTTWPNSVLNSNKLRLRSGPNCKSTWSSEA